MNKLVKFSKTNGTERMTIFNAQGETKRQIVKDRTAVQPMETLKISSLVVKPRIIETIKVIRVMREIMIISYESSNEEIDGVSFLDFSNRVVSSLNKDKSDPRVRR